MKFYPKFVSLSISLIGLVMTNKVILAATPAYLGDLQAEKSVTVSTPAGDVLVDSKYSYFSGDEIITGEDGRAVLSLNENGTVYVNESSRSSINRINENYAINLSKGALRFVLNSGVPISVAVPSENVQFSSSPEGSGVSGTVLLNEDDELCLFESEEGVFQAIDGVGEVIEINSGETWSFCEGRFALVDQTAADQAVTAAAGAGIGSTGALIAIGIGGLIAIDAADGDNNNNPPPPPVDDGNQPPVDDGGQPPVDDDDGTPPVDDEDDDGDNTSP